MLRPTCWAAIALLAAVVALPRPARAEIHVLPGQQDTWLDETGLGTSTHGSDTDLHGLAQTGTRKRPMVQFDVSAIPASAVVTSAQLFLYVTDRDGSGTPTQVYRNTLFFVEGLASWFWNGAGVDTSVSWGTFVPDDTGWIEVEIGPLVQAWVDGTFPNFGLRLLTASVGDEVWFASREHPTAAFQPRLVVQTAGNPFKAASGTYTGDKTAARAIQGIGFDPDVVIVKEEGALAGVVRTATMSGTDSKLLGTNDPVVTGSILSLDAGGFTIGPDDEVNAAGVVYHWSAFRSDGSTLALGTYAGTGLDDIDVATGAAPEVVALFSEDTENAVVRFAAQPVDECFEFAAGGGTSNRIQDFRPDGFQIGDDNGANEDGIVFHWVAWQTTPEIVQGGTYVGDGLTDRPITAGIEPVWAMVRANGEGVVHRSSAMAIDYTLPLFEAGPFVEGIKAFSKDGLTVGNTDAVNKAGNTNYWAAFSSGSAADLTLTLAVDDSTADQDQRLTFTLQVDNAGPNSATSVEVTDVLPADLSYQFATPSQGAFSSGTGVWTVGTIPSGGSATMQLVADVVYGPSSTTIVNTAAITSVTEADPNPGGETDSVTITVNGTDLELVVTATPMATAEGDTVLLTIDLANLGPGSTTGVTVGAALPAGLTYLGNSRTQGGYNVPQARWSVGTLAESATATLDITAQVDPGTAGTTLYYSPAITASNQPDPVPGNDADTVAVSVGGVDLQVTKTVDNTNPDEASKVLFSVVVGNLGPDDATSVRLNDLLPAGLAYFSDVVSQGLYTPGSGLWNVGTVVAGDSATLDLTAEVQPGTAGSTLTNVASLLSSSPADSNPANDADSSAVLVRAADLDLQMIVDDAEPNAGQAITFSLTLNNLGPDSTGSVAVTDLLPDSLSYTTHTASQGTYAAGTGLWLVGTLLSGGAATLDLTATVDSAAIGSVFPNAAWISASAMGDPAAANDSAAVAITVSAADLSASLSVDVPDPAVGDTVVVTVAATNLGPDPASGVAVDYPVPAGLTYVSDNGAGAWLPGTGVWTIGSLGAVSGVALQVTLTTDPGTMGSTIVNSASISATDPSDPTPGNNTDSLSVLVRSADLDVLAAADDTRPNEGQTVQLTARVANKGPDDATGVEIADSLPAGLTYVSDTPGQGTYNSGTGIWTVGAIAVGDSALLTVNATVDPGTAGTGLTHTAVLSGSAPGDPAGANDTGSVVLTVQAADLGVTKTANKASATIGATVTYTVVVSNAGPDSATSVVVSDSLPSRVDYVSDAPTQGTYNEVTGIWDVGTIASGSSATLQITTTANAGGFPVTVTNTAQTFSADQADPNGANNADSASFTVLAVATLEQADLALTKLSLTPVADVGDTVQFRLELENRGPDPSTGCTVTDVLPGGLSYVSHTPSQGVYLSGTGQWTVGIVAVGDTASLDLFAAVAPSAVASTVTNTATITSSGIADSISVNNTDSDSVAVRGADVSLAVAVDNPRPDEGGTVRFTVDLANAGPDDGRGVTVTDLLPAGLTYQSDTPEAGIYDFSTGVWTVGAVTVGDTLTLDIWATVDPGTAGGTYTNVASVSGRTRGDPTTANDTDSVSVTVPAVDLAVRKSADRATAHEGDSIRFTVTVGNAGPDSVTGVALSDTLPAGLSYAADSTSQGSYVPGTGVWTIGAIAAGDSAFLVLDSVADPGTGGSTRTNTASLTAWDHTDTDLSNQADSAAVWILSADLGVTHAVSDPAAREGDTVSLTTVLSNDGPDATSGVTVAAALPAGLSLLSPTVGRGTWTDSTGVWDVGGMAVGDTVSLVVTATVDPGTAGTSIPSSATVTASVVTDPNGTNNSASAVINVPQGILVTAAQTSVLVIPGASGVALMTLSIANEHGYAVTLDALTATNVSVGVGTTAQLDASLGTIHFYQDDGDFVFQAARDTLLGTTTPSGGEGTFSGLGLALPSSAIGTFHLVADFSQACRDGDRLDLSLADPSALVFLEVVNDLTAWPVSPSGSATIDGMAAAQIKYSAVGNRSVTPGAPSVLVADVVVPANGYATDVLTELHFVNRGSALAGTDISSLDVWADGGDGAFDGGAADDRALGTATWGGSSWNLVSLSEPLPVAGQQLWVLASFALTGRPGATLRLELATSPTGVRVASSNDGPVDVAATAPDTFTISALPSSMAVTAAQTGATLSPDGSAKTPVFELEIANLSAVPETLSALTFSNSTTGPGTVPQRDADWTSLSLLTGTRSAILSGDTGRLDSKAGSFSGGLVTFSPLNLVIAPGDTVVATLSGGATVGARDSDLLDLLVSDPARIVFADSTVVVSGTFPLDPAGSFPVDGMVSAQVAVSPGLPPSLLTGSTRNVAWRARLPGNGYTPDVLQSLDVRNLGSAQDGSEIAGMELWWDFDGDGTPEPLTDDAAGRVGPLVFTGTQWEITGAGVSLPVAGTTVFLTVDVADQALVGSDVRLSVPVNGLGVASANDGPRDRSLDAPLSQTISTSDRVTVGSTVIPAGAVEPGTTDVPLLALVFTNDYTVSRTINRITVTNDASGPGTPAQEDLDTESGLLHLRVDSPSGAALATAIFTDGEATFSGFSTTLNAGQSRTLYVVADVSLARAADGDVLSASLADDAAVSFATATTVVAGWPVSSDAAHSIDGMVAAQIQENVAPPATLGPSEGPALALDVVLPSNGYRGDILRGLTLVNNGTAVAGDIDQMRLWCDGGDGAFDAGLGDDTALGPMSPISGAWTSPSLSSVIPVGGARYFVSVTSSPALVDGTTVQLAIPVGGVTVESGNDGPHDAIVENDDVLLFSTAALLASLDIFPNASTLADNVNVILTVRNRGDSTITGIAPSALVPDVPGVLGYLSGPSPGSLDLASGGQATFNWTFTADSAGSVRLTGSATGMEQGTGLMRQSPDATSDMHRVFLQAQELELFPVESMPFSINRGQTDVVPLSLTLTNNAAAGGSDIELLGLRIRLVDGAGAGVVPADLLSRVLVNEGTNVYLDKTSLEAAGDSLDLTLATPVHIPATSQVTLSLSLDIADSTAVPEFRITIPDGGQPWFVARDATSLAPASILLSPSASYPVQSGLARIVAEATRLDVSAVAGSDVTAAPGQSGLNLLDLRFLNPDPDSLAADVRISSFEVVLTDSAGAAVPQPAQILRRIRATAGFLSVVDRAVGAADDSTMTLSLSPLVSVPVNNAVVLRLQADLAATAPVGSYRLRLADSTSFDARDANTNAPVPALYATTPVEGPALAIITPADSAFVSGTPLIPAQVAVGAQDVPSLRLTIRHPGGSATGEIAVSALTVRCRDAVGAPLVPSTFVDAARVLRDTTEVGLTTGTPGSGNSFTIPLSGVTVAPGATDTLELRLDVEVTAPAVPFRLDVEAVGVVIVDAALNAPVAVYPDSGATFPLSSGLTQLLAPARDVVVGFADTMPAVLAASSGAPIVFASLTLTNPAAPTAGDIAVDRLTIRAADGNGTPMDLGAALTEVEAWVDGALWASSVDIDPADSKAELTGSAALMLSPAAARTVEFRARCRPGADVPSLKLGLDAPDIGVVQPPSSLLTIAVTPAPGLAFPFWTLAGNFSAVSLEESWSNFPNPFAAGRSETRFAFFLPQEGRVTLKLYTARGERVRTILDRAPLPAGLHQDRVWDGRNGSGAVVTNGVYLAEISVSYGDGSLERYLRKVAVVR